jgi:hypothetical protein
MFKTCKVQRRAFTDLALYSRIQATWAQLLILLELSVFFSLVWKYGPKKVSKGWSSFCPLVKLKTCQFGIYDGLRWYIHPFFMLVGRKKKNLMYTNHHKPRLKGSTAHYPCAGPTAITTKCCSLPAVAGNQAALLASMGEELHTGFSCSKGVMLKPNVSWLLVLTLRRINLLLRLERFSLGTKKQFYQARQRNCAY